MAEIHNALTAYPKLQDAFRRAIGEKSQSFSGLERAGETLTPVLDLWALPEWALLRGEILFSRQDTVSAAAGTFSSVELVNPTGSGVLAVVLEVGQLANTVQIGVDSGGALGVVATNQGVANDARWPNLGQTSRCTVVHGQLAAPVALSQDALNANNRSTRPYILQPGKKLVTILTAANLANSYTLFWTERPLLSGESGI